MSYWSVWPKLYTLTQLSRASPTDYPDQLQLIDLRRANLSGGISLVPTDTSLVDSTVEDQWKKKRVLEFKLFLTLGWVLRNSVSFCVKKY